MPLPRFELGSRTDLVLAGYKPAALPLSYRGVHYAIGNSQSAIRNILVGPARLELATPRLRGECSAFELRTPNWRGRRDLNPRPLDRQSSALPSEPRPLSCSRRRKRRINELQLPRSCIPTLSSRDSYRPGQVRTAGHTVIGRVLFQLSYGPVFKNWLRGKESNLQSPESESGVLPITPPRNNLLG